MPLLPPVTTAIFPVKSNRAILHPRALLQLAAPFQYFGQQLSASHHGWEAGVRRTVNQELDELIARDADVQGSVQVAGRLVLTPERQQDADGDHLTGADVEAGAGVH